MDKSYKVAGMTCGGCVNSVKKAIERIEGLTADVTLEDGKVVVHGAHEPSAIEQAVQEAGFDFKGELN